MNRFRRLSPHALTGHCEIIRRKPNAHPESVCDRLTKAHETVFLLSKSVRYYYGKDAIQGPNSRRLRSVWDLPNYRSQSMNNILSPLP